jgi:hypothetical protein
MAVPEELVEAPREMRAAVALAAGHTVAPVVAAPEAPEQLETLVQEEAAGEAQIIARWHPQQAAAELALLMVALQL